MNSAQRTISILHGTQSIKRKSVFIAAYVRAVTVRPVTANIVTRGTKLVTGRTSGKENTIS